MKSHIKRRQRERIKALKVQRQLADKAERETQPQPIRRIAEEAPRKDPEYEWKYGGVNPWGQESKSRWTPFFNYIKKSLVLSLLLFVGIWGWFQLPYSWAETGKEHIRHLLTDEWPARQMAKLYEQWLGGNPILIPSYQPAGDAPSQPAQASNPEFQPPLDGFIVQAYSPNNKGIRMASNESRVTAVGEGRVMYVADAPSAGTLVLIQHADGIESLYGNLDRILVSQNDWVRAGQSIGYLAEQSRDERILFFAMKRDRVFVDPADVITFD